MLGRSTQVVIPFSDPLIGSITPQPRLGRLWRCPALTDAVQLAGLATGCPAGRAGPPLALPGAPLLGHTLNLKKRSVAGTDRTPIPGHSPAPASSSCPTGLPSRQLRGGHPRVQALKPQLQLRLREARRAHSVAYRTIVQPQPWARRMLQHRISLAQLTHHAAFEAGGAPERRPSSGTGGLEPPRCLSGRHPRRQPEFLCLDLMSPRTSPPGSLSHTEDQVKARSARTAGWGHRLHPGFRSWGSCWKKVVISGTTVLTCVFSGVGLGCFRGPCLRCGRTAPEWATSTLAAPLAGHRGSTSEEGRARSREPVTGHRGPGVATAGGPWSWSSPCPVTGTCARPPVPMVGAACRDVAGR